jgi:hypothetical protein
LLETETFQNSLHLEEGSVFCHICLNIGGHYVGHYQQINKGKTIPLQAWTGLEGSRRLGVPDFKTTDT